jgi:hypothetical protein
MRVPLETAHVRFTDHCAGWALVGQPRPPGAGGNRDRMDQQRFGAGRLARMPKVDDARRGGIRALLFRLRLQLAQPFGEQHATQIARSSRGPWAGMVTPARAAGKPGRG